MELTQDAIAQLLQALSAQQDASAKGEPAPATEAIPTADQFVSLGFVVTGRGDAPTEGDIYHVPTKAGKTARVRLIDQVDISPFRDGAEVGDWCFTYKRLPAK